MLPISAMTPSALLTPGPVRWAGAPCAVCPAYRTLSDHGHRGCNGRGRLILVCDHLLRSTAFDACPNLTLQDERTSLLHELELARAEVSSLKAAMEPLKTDKAELKRQLAEWVPCTADRVPISRELRCSAAYT
jgi:hypothetical protein